LCDVLVQVEVYQCERSHAKAKQNLHFFISPVLGIVSVKEMNGGLLIVSQFTLYGDVRRGLRPSWSDAAAPEVAEPLYDYYVESSRKLLGRVETGSFRKTMQVELVNDGPVTILLDSRKGF
jgi:D-tyrosyl-tRNA(Tyr) deacylase